MKEALDKVGPVVPTLDTDTAAWVFESPHFPHLEAHGESADEVIALYPRLLEQHLQDLQAETVSDFILQATPNWGGHRPNAGRPRGNQGVQGTDDDSRRHCHWLHPRHVLQLRQWMHG